LVKIELKNFEVTHPTKIGEGKTEGKIEKKKENSPSLIRG
jgi:hypothetical protein